ncbi:MAG TPA: hypothetical protein VM736_08780 [Gemmatimonadales bacterium]|nr:hypothetical protein [Gemmatimonadales bacterium]
MSWRLCVAAAALAAAPLGAQQATPMPQMMGDPMAMQEMMAPVMRVMAYAPSHLLEHRAALALSADQVTRLTALRDAPRAAREAARSEAKAHLEALRQAAEATTLDTAALKPHFQAAFDAMGKAHWVALLTALRARAVLDDAQRAKVNAWADSAHASMQQHRHMMKPSESH